MRLFAGFTRPLHFPLLRLLVAACAALHVHSFTLAAGRVKRILYGCAKFFGVAHVVV